MDRAERTQPRLMDVRMAAMPRVWRSYLENERAIFGVLSFVGFFVFWEVGAAVGWVDLFFFSSPSRILTAAIREVQLPRLWDDFRVRDTELIRAYLRPVAPTLQLVNCARCYLHDNSSTRPTGRS